MMIIVIMMLISDNDDCDDDSDNEDYSNDYDDAVCHDDDVHNASLSVSLGLYGWSVEGNQFCLKQ